MLIKTPLFDEKLQQSFYSIAINTKNPPTILGSYKLKSFGDVITDIDINSKVYINEKLVERILYILNQISRSHTYVFIQTELGYYFDLGWSIDDKGGCSYSQKKVEEWFDILKKSRMVPPDDLKRVQNLLFKDEISIKDLIDSEKILEPYRNIIWSKKDIENGVIRKNGNEYIFLEEAKKNGHIVLEFIYLYLNEENTYNFCTIDYALVDYNLPQQSVGNYQYYVLDYYKMLKLYKRKIKKIYMINFIKSIKKLEMVTSLISMINLLIKVDNSYVVRNPLISNELAFILKEQCFQGIQEFGLVGYKPEYLYIILNKLKEEQDKLSKEEIKLYKDKLELSGKLELEIYENRAKEAETPISKKVLLEREMKGLVCPFFDINIEDYRFLFNLGKRLLLPSSKVVECFRKISNEKGIPVKNLINELFKNTKLHIQIDSDKVNLLEEGIIKDTYSLDDLNNIRVYILFGKELI